MTASRLKQEILNSGSWNAASKAVSQIKLNFYEKSWYLLEWNTSI